MDGTYLLLQSLACTPRASVLVLRRSAAERSHAVHLQRMYQPQHPTLGAAFQRVAGGFQIAWNHCDILSRVLTMSAQCCTV